MTGSDLDALTTPLDARQLQAVASAVAALSPTQTVWVSGYLAGLAQAALTPAAPASPTQSAVPAATAAPALTLLYGSQTGNARGVAEQLGARLRDAGVAVQVVSMGDYSPRRLAKERLLLLVVSTHGDGEPPESAQALHALVMGARAPQLGQLRFAVVGLGDSSYEHFCRTAVDLDRRLAELGARRLLALQCCDVDFQGEVEAWAASALERLVAEAGAPAPGANVVALPGVQLPAAAPVPDRAHPALVALLENRRITAADAVADCRHLALGCDPAQLRYRPGDALGLWCRNDPALVAAILDRLDLSGAAPVDLPAGLAAAGPPGERAAGNADLPLREALLGHCELTLLHPTTVRAWLAQPSREPGAEAAARALLADAAALRAYAGGRQFLDLIDEHPRQVDPSGLLALLRPLQPRLYSIASSQAEADDEIHLTISLVRYQARQRDCLGAASGWLGERLGRDARVPVWVVENPAFRLPTDGATPIIMIGAGTGIAPYRAFLQERAATGARGDHWLLFGNRHFHRDFLYQLDWQAWRRAGLLQRVDLAFSRDGSRKRYVQHLLREQAPRLREWLAAGAHLYVCGGLAMGQAVHETLIDCLAGDGPGGDRAAGAAALDELRQAARYHRDLY